MAVIMISFSMIDPEALEVIVLFQKLRIVSLSSVFFNSVSCNIDNVDIKVVGRLAKIDFPRFE
jgi:hypothetical protein